MQIFEEVAVPSRIDKKCVSISCDFCGKQGRYGGWEESYFDVDETEISVTIKQRDGKNYPECGSGEKFHCDMCPTCFKEKLFPFLQSISKTAIDYEEWDN